MANINKVALLNNGKVVGAGRNKDNSNLAPIEATTTASRSYLVGDYLMLQGEFYKVISAIAIGDTLTVETNIQSTSVGDEIVNVKTRVHAHTIGAPVSISTSANTTYTFTSDGYLTADIDYASDQYLYIESATDTQRPFMYITTTHSGTSGMSGRTVQSVFVKRGMSIKVRASNVNSNASIRFYPLS